MFHQIRNGAIGMFLFSRKLLIREGLLEASGRLLKLRYGAGELVRVSVSMRDTHDSFWKRKKRSITSAFSDHEGEKDITSKGDLDHDLPMAFDDVRDMALQSKDLVNTALSTHQCHSPPPLVPPLIEIMNVQRSNGDQPQCDLDDGRDQSEEESPGYF
ncbi:hypothetical protein V6N12_067967 [Hibiscus sabdariffa]|uniref:Uncharacterized protein n=1 Tax=Hibiscus sabdariffa TaxID=183260 RepID=A0ABR2FNL3_9ROSI